MFTSPVTQKTPLLKKRSVKVESPLGDESDHPLNEKYAGDGGM